MRLAVTFVAPQNEITPGSTAYLLGPYCCHFAPLCEEAGDAGVRVLAKPGVALGDAG